MGHIEFCTDTIKTTQLKYSLLLGIDSSAWHKHYKDQFERAGESANLHKRHMHLLLCRCILGLPGVFVQAALSQVVNISSKFINIWSQWCIQRGA
jgi:hypothetical protein